jgi:hypothetical protein
MTMRSAWVATSVSLLFSSTKRCSNLMGEIATVGTGRCEIFLSQFSTQTAEPF